MTTLEHATGSIGSAARPALVVRVANMLAGWYRALKNRRAFYRLGEMSDVELADIGLTRADLSVAVDLGNDPTAHLGRMARERVVRMEKLGRR